MLHTNWKEIEYRLYAVEDKVLWERAKLVEEFENTMAEVLCCTRDELNYWYATCRQCRRWYRTHDRDEHRPETDDHSYEQVWCGHNVLAFIRKVLRDGGAYELHVTSAHCKSQIQEVPEDPSIRYNDDWILANRNTWWIGDMNSAGHMVCGSNVWYWLFENVRSRSCLPKGMV